MRLVNFSIKFDIDVWGRWAEFAQLDNRAINFALHYSHEIFETDNKTINPRSFTTFCKAIAGLDTWSDFETKAMILTISKGCFDDKDNVVGTLFTTFLENRLDELVSPKELLQGDWDKVQEEIKKVVYKNNDYQAHIASILATRLSNYIAYYFEQPKAKSDVVHTRLLEFVTSEEMLFSKDLLYNIIKPLVTNYAQRMNSLLLYPEIQKVLR